ncbi:MAG: hypothetical protein WC865_12120 [Bacteroidales bacterium]
MNKKNKTGGRQAGTPNKLTKDVREVLKSAVSTELDQLDQTLNLMTPKERLDAIIRMLPFVIPKLKDLEMPVGATNTDEEIFTKFLIEGPDRLK